MKKTLLALAVAGVIAAPAAMAEVTVYGQAHVSVGTNDNGEDSVTAVNSNSSRFGVKAAESLDGGLTAVAQFEFGVAVDSNGTTTQVSGDKDANANVSARNQFVGLAGGFGTILAGRHDAPNKMSTGAMDIFADTVADYNAIIGVNGASDVRADNAIAYVAPAIAGATIVLAYVPESAKDAKDEATSAAIMWGQGPLSINVGYLGTGEGLKLSGTAGGFVKDIASTGGVADGATAEVTNVRLGVGYAVSDALKVGAIYETLEADKLGGSGEKLEFTDFLINAAYSFGGGNTVKVEYGVLEGDSGNADALVALGLPGVLDEQSTVMAVGFDHAFSKTTSAYAIYAAMDNDDNMTSSLGVVGSGANIKAAAFGKDPSAIEVGMVVKF